MTAKKNMGGFPCPIDGKRARQALRLLTAAALLILLGACATAKEEPNPPRDGAEDRLPDNGMDPAWDRDLPFDDGGADLPPEALPETGEEGAADPDLTADLNPDVLPDPDPAEEVQDLLPDPDAVEEELPPAPGTTCATAIDLTGLTTWSGRFSDYRDLWSGGWTCEYGDGPEVWLTVTVPASQRLSLEESSATDVVIHRLDACGATECAWSTDEPETLGYYNDTGGDVSLILIVEQYDSWSGDAVQLTIDVGDPAAGYDCANPIDLSALASWSGSLADYADLWAGGAGCTGAYGPEIWFTATVPAGNKFVLEQTDTADVVIHRVSACGTDACDWSSDEPEKFEYFNDTPGPVTFLFVVEQYDSWSGDSVRLSITNAPPPGGYDCTGAIDLTTLAAWSGSFADYGNLWDGGAGCRAASGPEAWFTVTVAAGNRLILEETGATDVVLHRVAACGTTACAWSSDTPERFEYLNDTGSAVTFTFVVEKYGSGSTGAIQLTIANAPPVPGFSCGGAVDVSALATWAGPFADYANLWTGGAGCRSASGPEAWFTASVADGNRFLLEETGTTDVVLHRVAACATTACAWSSDTPERFEYFNDTGSAVTFTFVIEKYGSGSTGAIQLAITNAPPPPGFSCGGAIDLTSLASWSGSYADYANLWTGGTGCLSASGPEVWFTATVADGSVFTLHETSVTDVVLHRVAACATTACLWSSDLAENFSFTNSTGSPVTLYLVVEKYGSGSSDVVSVTATNGL